MAREKSTHPHSIPTIFVDVSTKKRFYTVSTLPAREKVVEDGIEYGVHFRDVTSDSHPIYTGEKRFVDTAGRIDKFRARMSKRSS